MGTYSNFQNNPGSTTCLPCLPGSRAGVAGTPVCEQCPLGKYNSFLQTNLTLFGAVDCLLCPLGKASNALGALTCTSCVPGKIGPVQGSLTVRVPLATLSIQPQPVRV
jgi:hypothetical protein